MHQRRSLPFLALHHIPLHLDFLLRTILVTVLLTLHLRTNICQHRLHSRIPLHPVYPPYRAHSARFQALWQQGKLWLTPPTEWIPGEGLLDRNQLDSFTLPVSVSNTPHTRERGMAELDIRDVRLVSNWLLCPFAHGRFGTWGGFRTRTEALLWSTCSKLLRRSQPLNLLTLEKDTASSLGLNLEDLTSISASRFMSIWPTTSSSTLPNNTKLSRRGHPTQMQSQMVIHFNAKMSFSKLNLPCHAKLMMPLLLPRRPPCPRWPHLPLPDLVTDIKCSSAHGQCCRR